MNQLDRIMQVTGYPTPEDIESMKSPFAATMLESLPKNRPKPLAEMFPRASSEALDLLRLCFQFNPARRITAKEALRHPYVVQFHNPDDEFDCDRVIRIPVDDNTKLRVQDYRDQIYNEVLRKKKEQRRSHRRTLETQQAAAAAQQPSAQAQQQPTPQQQQQMQADHAAYQHRTNSKNGMASSGGSSGVARSSGHVQPARSSHSNVSPSGGQYAQSGHSYGGGGGASGGSYGHPHGHYQASQQASKPVQYQDGPQRAMSAHSYAKQAQGSSAQSRSSTGAGNSSSLAAY